MLRHSLIAIAVLFGLALAPPALAASGELPRDITYKPTPPAPKNQLPEQAGPRVPVA